MSRKVAILAVATLTVVAGCTGTFLGGGGGGGDGPPPIDHVPGDANFLVTYDSELVKDPATKSVVNKYLQTAIPESSDQPRTLEGIMERAKNQSLQQTNLSITEVGGATVFGKIPSTMGAQSQQYVGVIVRANWKKSDVVSAINKNADVTESTYQGVTLYKSSSGGTTGVLANYKDGLYAVGTEAAVKDIIDVSKGNADPISGDVKSAYESTNSDGYVRFAMALPETIRQRAGQQMGGTISTGNLTHISGAYYTEGGQDGTIGMNVNMHMKNSESATSLRDELAGLKSIGKNRISESKLKQQLDAIEITADGDTVAITYEQSVSSLNSLIEWAANQGPLGVGGGGGGGGSQQTAPQVSVDFEYDASSGTVTAVHQGGDTLDGAQVRAVCGQSLISTPSGEIAAGDTIVETTECSSGDTLRIVWQDSSTGQSAVLAQFEVPGSSASLPAPALVG